MAFDILATHKEVNLVRDNLLANLATIETTTTASTDYAEGDYLVFNTYLYRTTEAITAGATLNPGTGGNIAQVDVASQFGSGSVELTQAQYDALTEKEKMADVVYLITDSPANYLDEVFGSFATVEYTSAASKAYTVGEYLVNDNKFYVVSAAIAQGDTITPGTNVTQTTVGAEVSKGNLWYSSKNVASTSGASGELLRIEDARITADHILSKFRAANPSVITDTVTCNTSAGLAIFTGKSTAATTAEILLVKKNN